MSARSKSACSVRIKPSSPPSVTVLCHRPRINNYSKPCGNKDNVSVIDVLKKGGSLPRVHPEERGGRDNCAVEEDVVKQNSRTGYNSTRSKQPPNIRSGRLESKAELSTMKNGNSNNANKLEQRVELLNDELSKVRQVLVEQCQKPDTNGEKEAFEFDAHLNNKTSRQKLSDHFRKLSAREYVFIVTEMNEDMHFQPYDPNEFTELVQSDPVSGNQGQCHIQGGLLNVNSLCEVKKAEILHALQNELSTWRKEQEELSERRPASEADIDNGNLV